MLSFIEKNSPCGGPALALSASPLHVLKGVRAVLEWPGGWWKERHWVSREEHALAIAFLT